MSTVTDGTIIRSHVRRTVTHKQTRGLGRRSACIDRSPRYRIAAVAVGVLACLLMVVSASPAFARWGFHDALGEGYVAQPVDLAVDEAGNLYVGALGGNIYKFNLAGEPVTPSPFFEDSGFVSGVAVNPVSHNLYVVNASEQAVQVLNSTTRHVESSFAIPGTGNIFGAYTFVQIAADESGNVYVPDAPGNEIQVFNERGEAPSGGVSATIKGSGVNELKGPEGVAVDAAGNVWVADTGDERIEEFGPDGTFIKEIGSPHVQAVAVDGSGDVFASVGGEGIASRLLEYNANGAQIAEIGAGLLSETDVGIPQGIAVDSGRELVYIADTNTNVIQRFTSWSVTTGLPSKVAQGQATVRGTIEVEPGTSIPTCKFEYGTSTAYGSSVPCSPNGAYTANTSVSTILMGLTPGADYHYRISATNGGGFTQVGVDGTFGPPMIDGESAEAAVTTVTPRAHVTVVMEGESTCQLQYVDEAEYAVSGYAHANAVPCAKVVGKAVGEYDIETQTITGLQPETVYHYRFVTANQAGTSTGASREFATFGLKSFAFEALALSRINEQAIWAGTHPNKLTDTFSFNTSAHKFTNGTMTPVATDANPKDIVTELPVGLIGNPDATPKCEPYDVAHADCSGATQVGTMTIYTANPSSVEKGELLRSTVPIYNLLPPVGVAAQFGARFNGYVTVHIDSRVRTGGDYGVTAEAINSSTAEGIVGAEVTLWGVPAEESHDQERFCPSPGKANEVEHCFERGPLTPLLTNPTACTGERTAHMTVNSWQDPSIFVRAEAKMPSITGCGKLDFRPSVAVSPTTTMADSSSGLHVELRVPQNESPTGLAEADLKDVRLTLPAGLTVNPSSANGLAGCPLLTGKEGHPGVPGIDLENGEPANCPNASKVGKVTIKTPLLEEEVTGGVYVAQQTANPFKSLLALYIDAEAPERDVVVKLAGHVSLEREESNGVVTKEAGQLTTTFDENPQLPFETLKLDFFGGERASLATPRACGAYQSTSMLEPWSHQGASGETGTPDAEPFISPFAITSGPGGAPCSSVGGFTPGFAAGTQSNAAASFSPFVMNLTRKDSEQVFSTVGLTMPLGLAGDVSTVTLCPETKANAGTCSASSKIGYVRVSAGVGNEPITLPEAGKPEDPVYLTESYKGAPFGLSVVVPAQAGPFNLDEGGHPIVVRAKIEINPYNAQVTVVSDPQPTRLQGIPLDVRDIEVVVDKPGFIFNPTSCSPTSVDGTIGSAEGTSANVSSRFQAADCTNLPFKPSFSALTNATHTRFGGDSLHVVVKSAQGQANLKEVHVELPKVLPSRLSTINLACPEAVFAANPGACPAGSRVGVVSAQTPLLSVPIVGPAYFVSHGGAKFPELIFVLQGEGVTVQLNGETFISKAGITSSTFKALPDVPVSRVDVVLPAGQDSVLTGEGDLCAHPLYMPTTLVGQNGAVIKERTRIAVAGCKPELIVLRHKVNGATATIVVKTPFAGRLTASGKGLSRAVKRLGKSGVATVRLTLTKAERVLLARHRGRRLKVRVELRFTSGRGPVLTHAVSVLIG